MDEAAKEFMKMYYLLIEARDLSKEKKILASKSKGLRSASPPEKALEYTLRNLDGNRWFRGEPLILQDPQTAISYASRVIKGPWPELENLILTHHNKRKLYGEPAGIHDKYKVSYIINEYTYHVLKKRWPEAELLMMTELKSATTNKNYILSRLCDYARSAKERWPELEEEILNSLKINPRTPRLAVLASYYARDVIKGPWEEAEPLILDSECIEAIRIYATDVLKRPWIEAEEIVSKDPREAYQYAVLLNRRILENEKSIFEYFYNKDNELTIWSRYIAMAKERIPVIEELAAKNAESSYEYCAILARNNIFSRIPELERAIKRSPKYAFFYAVKFLKSRWKDAEPIISRTETTKYDYESFFCKKCNGIGYEEISGGERVECEDCLGGGLDQNKVFYPSYYG